MPSGSTRETDRQAGSCYSIQMFIHMAEPRTSYNVCSKSSSQLLQKHELTCGSLTLLVSILRMVAPKPDTYLQCLDNSLLGHKIVIAVPL